MISNAANLQVADRIYEMIETDQENFTAWRLRVAQAAEQMYEGDTFWLEDERTGATLKDGKFYAMTSWRADHIGSGVFYTLASEVAHNQLSYALIHAGLILEAEEAA